MKVACMSWRSAASRSVRLKKNTSSASDSGSACEKLISIWPAPVSWISVSMPSSICSQYAYTSSNSGRTR
jgi:hypothetical protein